MTRPHNPYDSLGRILSSGGEIGLARAMADKAHPESVGTFIEKRLSNLSAYDVNYVKDLASSILEAGRLLSAAGENEPVNWDDIPTNGDLFGDEWEGKRVFWFGEWNIPGEDEWYKFSGTLPDLPDKSYIARYAAELAHSYIEAYKGKFIKKLPEYQGEVRVRIIGTEKAY